MPVPLITLGIVFLKASLRPINKLLLSQFKNAGNYPMGFKFFAGLGHVTFKIETFTKSAEDRKKDEKNGKKAGELPDEVAFNMGIDWFTEIFFFYGTLCAVVCWEFNKFVERQKQLRLRLTNLESNTDDILNSLCT